MASDGLWDVLTNDDVYRIVTNLINNLSENEDESVK